ncbi:MAG: hypothetical protein IPI32_01740 [Austwickia sp.]|jgi:hypothetical protein|nr:hypothetical protein [Austwickia sp.]MBK8437683.1 hypothetical protein [Austwickia sp.]MBK9099994.1 hypothetical protein [Austwickia sp.]
MTCPHVFLTRFNLPTTKIENSIYSPTWLTDRYQLFRRFTVPSVRAQTASDVHWIIYLDPESPSWLKEAMAELEQEGLVTPNYGGKVGGEYVLEHLRTLLGRDEGPVITSNLDNDDGLAVDFAQRLRVAPVRGAESALYITQGLIHCDRRIYLRRDPENAFVAVRSDLSALTTCWSEWHNRLHTLMPVVTVDGPPGWLQVVHGRNVSNRVRGRLVDPQAYRQGFPGLLDDIDPVSVGEQAHDLLVRQPARGVRDAVRGNGAKAAVRLFGQQGLEDFKYRVRRGRHSLTRATDRGSRASVK